MFKNLKNFILLLSFLIFSGCDTGPFLTRFGEFNNDHIYFATTIQAVNNQNAKYSIRRFDAFQEYTNRTIFSSSHYSLFLPYRYSDQLPFSVTGVTPVYNIIYWFKVNRVWDAASQQYDFSFDRAKSFLPDNLVFEIKNQLANQQLQLRIPAIVINGTNETLSKNFIYREGYNLTFSMLTNHFKVNQDHCYFPEVNIFLPANATEVISLPITNDINKNGYYCYLNETKKIDIQL